MPLPQVATAAPPPSRPTPPRKPHAATFLLPLLILAGGFAATLWVYLLLVRDADTREEMFFSERVAEAQSAIRERVTHYIDALHGGASHVAAAPQTNQESWRIYTESLDLRRRYPGINGLGIMLAVQPAEVAAWQARFTAPGGAAPEIKPFPGTPAGPPDDVKYLITAVETADAGQPPIGRDIATEPSRRRAAERARDTGRAHINQRIPASRDTQRRAGLLVYVPLYQRGMPLGSTAERRAAHFGWVYAQVFPDIFLEGVLEPMQDQLRLHFFEAGELSRERLLYPSPGAADGPLPAFEKVTDMTLAGERFRVGWIRGPRFPRVERTPARLVAASMGLATLFLAGLVLSLQSTTRRASAMAASRTAELAASEERFRQAFDFAGIGMALVGLDGQLARVNQALCDILGYPESRLLQKKFQEITHPDDLAADLTLFAELIAGQRRSYQLEKRYLHRDGHSVWSRLTVSLVRDPAGGPLNAIAQVEDIAERRRLEAAITRSRDDALEASRAKSEFLATLVHQIRAPANEVVGVVARLRNRLAAPEHADSVSALEASGSAFLSVLNDILEYSNIEFNRVQFESRPFNLRACVSDAVARHEGRAEQKRLRLESRIEPSTPVLVAGDAKRLGQIISGLLSTAIRFTEAGEVRLSLTAEPLDAKTGRQRLKFAVRDTGSGIAANATFRTSGAIELAISQRLTELMGGMLWNESDLGRGTTFHFTIPVEPLDAAARPPDP